MLTLKLKSSNELKNTSDTESILHLIKIKRKSNSRLKKEQDKDSNLFLILRLKKSQENRSNSMPLMMQAKSNGIKQKKSTS